MTIYLVTGWGIDGDNAYIEADSPESAMSSLLLNLTADGTIDDATPQEQWLARPAIRPLRLVFRRDY